MQDAARVEVRLADMAVSLRRLQPGDREEVRAGFDRLSEQSRYQRFFTAMPTLPDSILDKLMDLDDRRRVAIVAIDGSRPSPVGGPEGLGVAIARFIEDAADPKQAELAVVVADEYQGRGLGRVLMEALVVGALHSGHTRLYGDVLETNRAMLRQFTRFGAFDRPIERPEAGVRRLYIDLEAAVRTIGPRRALYEPLFR